MCQGSQQRQHIETVFSGVGRISNKSRKLSPSILSDYAFCHLKFTTQVRLAAPFAGRDHQGVQEALRTTCTARRQG